jgi:hypothetical protein
MGFCKETNEKRIWGFGDFGISRFGDFEILGFGILGIRSLDGFLIADS